LPIANCGVHYRYPIHYLLIRFAETLEIANFQLPIANLIGIWQSAIGNN
jgi:hypothetical protein